MRILLIDDMRNENSPEVKAAFAEVGLPVVKLNLIARDYWTARNALVQMGPWDLVLLDHDLGDFSEGRERNGYHLVEFLELNSDDKNLLPLEIKLVTSNPVGRKKMADVLTKLYGREIR